MKSFAERFILGLVSLVMATVASAEPFESVGWRIDAKPLLLVQSSEDTALLSKTVEATKQAVCSLELRVPIAEANRMLMVRFQVGYPTTWFLFRTQTSSIVARLMSHGRNRIFSSEYAEANQSDWDTIFEKFAKFQQRPPTPPLGRDVPMLAGRVWPPGYSGVVNVYEEGKSREYLLATDDVRSIRIQGPVDAFLCSTLFSGMHCRVGAEVNAGWAQKDLEELLARAEASEKESRVEPASPPPVGKFSSRAAIEPACLLPVVR